MKILSRAFLGENTYITYPHCNAFAAGGRILVYMRLHQGLLELRSYDLDARTHTHLQTLGAASELGRIAWYDVALRAPKVAAVFQNKLWLLDLENPSGWTCAYEPLPAVQLDGLCSITADGNRILCGEIHPESRRALEIDLTTGGVRELFTKTWHSNHFHYCPHDESWVAFSHEGPAESSPDRCWVWHAQYAPQGRVAFDQASEKPGVRLCVGHERWGFHDVSAYVPAYAVSPEGKRGLYEIFGDGRPARLIWENDVLWHCNMDQSGRFVVVDTTGPFGEYKLDEKEFAGHLARHLQTDREKSQNTSDVALLDLKTRKSLCVATVIRTQHPYHPHPALNSQANCIAWNDASESAPGAWAALLAL